jgi:thioredoxin 1
MIRDIETFEKLELEIEHESNPVFLYFFAPWCSICHAYGFKIEQFSNKFPHIKVIKINVSISDVLSQTYKVLHVPSIVVLKDNEVIQRFSTVVPVRELEKIIGL